jgi:hypothetical protein
MFNSNPSTSQGTHRFYNSDKSVNGVQGKDRCLLWESYGTYKYSVEWIMKHARCPALLSYYNPIRTISENFNFNRISCFFVNYFTKMSPDRMNIMKPNYRTTDKLWSWKDLERSGRGPYYPSISQERLQELIQDPRQDIPCLGQHTNGATLNSKSALLLLR